MLARVGTRFAARQLAPALFVRQKTTTGIVGLEVVPDAKPVLLGLYAKTLSMLEGVPAEAQYRKVITDYTKARMAVLKSTDDIPTIESKIGGGQVEQLIEQAKDELSLIPKLIAARAFDPYNGSPAEEILTDLKRCSPPAARLSRWPCSTHLGPAAHLTLGPALRLPECPGVAWRCRGTTSRCAHRRTTQSRRRSSWSCLPCLRPQRRLKCITESSAARDTCTSDPPPLCPAYLGGEENRSSKVCIESTRWRRACDRPRRVEILVERSKFSFKTFSLIKNIMPRAAGGPPGAAPHSGARSRRVPRWATARPPDPGRSWSCAHAGPRPRLWGGERSRAGGCLMPPAVGFDVSQIATARRNLATIPYVGSG